MSFDEMITYTYDFIATFSGFGEYTMMPLSDIFWEFGIKMPAWIGDHTLFGLMFGGGILLIVAITMVKWALDTIN